jgi:hypothetical protein
MCLSLAVLTERLSFKMKDAYATVVRQDNGSLIKVLLFSQGTLGYYSEYPGCWRLVWEYGGYGQKPLAEALPFTVKSEKYAEELIRFLNLIVSPSRISYVHGTTGTQPKAPANPKECMPAMEQEYGDYITHNPDAVLGKARQTLRRAPEGWIAADYDVAEVLNNQWDKKVVVTVKYGFTRNRLIGACKSPSHYGKIELTHLPTGMHFWQCETWQEATKAADVMLEVMPDGVWATPPEADVLDRAREALSKLRG